MMMKFMSKECLSNLSPPKLQIKLINILSLFLWYLFSYQENIFLRTLKNRLSSPRNKSVGSKFFPGVRTVKPYEKEEIETVCKDKKKEINKQTNKKHLSCGKIFI